MHNIFIRYCITDMTESGSPKTFLIIGIVIACLICTVIAVVRIKHILMKERPEGKRYI